MPHAIMLCPILKVYIVYNFENVQCVQLWKCWQCSVALYSTKDTTPIPTFPTGVPTGATIASPGITKSVSFNLTAPLMLTSNRCVFVYRPLMFPWQSMIRWVLKILVSSGLSFGCKILNIFEHHNIVLKWRHGVTLFCVKWETLWPLEAQATEPNYHFVHTKSISHALGILWLAMACCSWQNIRELL